MELVILSQIYYSFPNEFYGIPYSHKKNKKNSHPFFLNVFMHWIKTHLFVLSASLHLNQIEVFVFKYNLFYVWTTYFFNY